MADITGTAYIKVNGKTLRTEEGAELDPGGYEKTAMMNGRIYHGTNKKGVPSVLTCTVVHKADTDLVELSNIEGATIIYETDTEDSYMISNADASKPAKLGGEGKISMEFTGAPAKRL